MSDKSDAKIRWLRLGGKARQVYDLPATIPWLDNVPPPGPDDHFINISILGMAATLFGEKSASDDWERIRLFCELCEEAGECSENFDYARALELLGDAENSHGCAFVHWQRCICHIEMRQPEQAMAAAHHAAALAPGCGVFWRVFGELCQDRGLPAEAADAFEKAFFGGEHTPSVIAAMRGSGLLVPNPCGGDAGILVSPHVARAILRTHIASVRGKQGGKGRLRSLAKKSLENASTAGVAVFATEFLMGEGATDNDRLMHAEALWRAGFPEAGKQVLGDILDGGGGEVVGGKLLALTREILPARAENVRREVVRRGPISREVVEEVFRGNGPENADEIAEFAQKHASGEAWVVAAERFVRLKRRKEALAAAQKAIDIGGDVKLLDGALRVLVDIREYERACAAAARIAPERRTGLSCFLFGEALWQLGEPGLALPLFREASKSDVEESIVQNSQMREAQCCGFLLPLGEFTTLSPTRRLGRSLVVAGHEWSSIVAPVGLPSASYIRINLDKEFGSCDYRAFEFSKQKGEMPLGGFRALTRHDSLAMAIEPSGQIFVGAKLGERWVKTEVGE